MNKIKRTFETVRKGTYSSSLHKEKWKERWSRHKKYL